MTKAEDKLQKNKDSKSQGERDEGQRKGQPAETRDCETAGWKKMLKKALHYGNLYVATTGSGFPRRGETITTYFREM